MGFKSLDQEKVFPADFGRRKCTACGGSGYTKPPRPWRNDSTRCAMVCGSCGGRGWHYTGREFPVGNWFEVAHYQRQKTAGMASHVARTQRFVTKPGSTPTERVPSNTGIFARGPQRGWLFTKPGETPDCMPEVLEHFTTGSKGWINGPARTVEQPESDAKPDVL